MNVTRRKLARMIASSTALTGIAIAGASVSAEAQTPAANSDEETQSAHDLLRNNAQALAKVKMPITTEPAVHFKA
jgi:hypothetical protein